MKKIRIAIAGVGNCASALIQGIEFYRRYKHRYSSTLAHYDIGGYKPYDIEIVAAFDIDKRKIKKDISQAIFSAPNCTKIFFKNVPNYGVSVQMGKILDGIASHMKNYSEDETFTPANKPSADIVKILKKTKAEILINYLPVGAEKASRYYARCCLEAGVAFINAIPVFIASNKKLANAFKKKNIPLVGDDIKSQLGATILHRTLIKLFEDRGIKFERTYQLNIGGNTDFLNMLSQERLKSKRISKTEAVRSQIKSKIREENIRIGPSDYIRWLKDNKICFIRIDGKGFGNVPIKLELKLSVEDSPNSAGIMIDVIRCCKLALNRKIGGVLTEISAYAMKHPPIQMSDWEAKEKLEKFIRGGI